MDCILDLVFLTHTGFNYEMSHVVKDKFQVKKSYRNNQEDATVL